MTIEANVQDRVMLGGRAVDGLDSLTVRCATPSSSCDATPGSPGLPDYAGAVLSLDPNDELRMAVINSISLPPAAPKSESHAGMSHGGGTPEAHCMTSSGDWDPDRGWVPQVSLLNMHNHGLLVPPYLRRAADGSVTLGDNAFHCEPGPDGKLHYDILLGVADGATVPAGTSQPIGVNWFHPHIHGIAKAQISSGMAGMIVVGDAAYSDQEGNGIAWSRERNIMLKDIQIVQPTPGGPWLNFADQEPDFCGENKFGATNLGSCELAEPAVAEVVGSTRDPLPGFWVFSLNGAVYPTITVRGSGGPDAVDHRELWRVQNASANVTYRLSLRPIGSEDDGPVLDAPFEVLKFDGASAVGPIGRTAVAPLVREILLMPGARAELAVGRPDFGLPGADTSRDIHYQLVNEAFQAGFSADTADTWPRVALAHVVFKGTTESEPAARVQLQPPFEEVPDMALRSREEPQAATEAPVTEHETQVSGAPHYDPDAVAALCADLSQIGFDPSTTIRRIYFAIKAEEDGEFFLLGETFVNTATGAEFDPSGHPVLPGGSIPLQTFDPARGYCALKVADVTQAETWELVNLSAEVHNFHMHQLKFTAARDRDGNVQMRTPSNLDRVNLVDRLLLASGDLELQHDTIIVPRGTDNCGDAAIERISERPDDPHGTREYLFDRARQPECTGDGRPGDQSGMLRVNLAFAGEQFAAYKEDPEDGQEDNYQPASFVFHCHILEHEDHGMMARLTVLDPAYLP